jgi:hypothetical protein
MSKNYMAQFMGTCIPLHRQVTLCRDNDPWVWLWHVSAQQIFQWAEEQWNI